MCPTVSITTAGSQVFVPGHRLSRLDRWFESIATTARSMCKSTRMDLLRASSGSSTATPNWSPRLHPAEALMARSTRRCIAKSSSVRRRGWRFESGRNVPKAAGDLVIPRQFGSMSRAIPSNRRQRNRNSSSAAWRLRRTAAAMFFLQARCRNTTRRLKRTDG